MWHFWGLVRDQIRRLFGGGHTHFWVEIGLNGGFSPKSAGTGRKPWFSGPGSQKHRFLGGRRNARYNTWLAGSIADAFSSIIAFCKNWNFSGVLGAFLTWPKSGYFTGSKAQSVFRLSFKNEKASTFVKVSIESSVFRAFDRALNEEASYFRLEMAGEMLLKKWLRS